MKRITAIAIAVLVTTLLANNFASAQPGVPRTQGKIAVPYPGPGPKPGPGPISFDQSTHIAWDSGELQKQTGSKNKDKIKIVMRVWCEYRHDSPTTYTWAVKYSLKAVDKNSLAQAGTRSRN